METDNILWLSILCIIVLKCNSQCSPSTIFPVTDVGTDDSVFFRCDLGSRSECITNIVAMEWHKRANGVWYPEFRLFPDKSSYDIPSEFDYTLDGRVSVDVTSGAYDLTIDRTILADGGDWICVYKGQDDQDTNESDVLTLNVTAPCDVTIEAPQDRYLLFDTPYRYTCTCSPVFPAINPVWVMGDKEYTGISNNRLHNYVWSIRNTIELRSSSFDEFNITCLMVKSGVTEWTNFKYTFPGIARIRAPPVAGNGTTTGAVYSQSGTPLKITCIGCGSDVTIEWTKDSKKQTFPNDLFYIEIKQTEASCPYSQTDATESILTWKPPPSQSCALCKYKVKHNGIYNCILTGLEGSQDISDDIIVEYLHTNGCISDGGLAGIIIGCIAGVVIVIIIVYFVIKNCNCKGNTK